MYVVREDAKILASPEVLGMKKKYHEKFGERFIAFNYIDFPSTETQIAGEVYREALRKALEDDKPFQMVSHRYDFIDH